MNRDSDALGHENERIGPPDTADGIPTRNHVWRTASGERIRIRNLTDAHLANVIRWLACLPFKVPGALGGAQTPDAWDWEMEMKTWRRDGFTRDEWLIALRRESQRRFQNAQGGGG